VLPPLVARGLWWRAVLIALAGALTYWNSLSGSFILDDQVTIVDNHQSSFPSPTHRSPAGRW
jgi:hypothetical protein